MWNLSCVLFIIKQLLKTVRTRVGIMRSSQSYIRMLFNRDQYNLERLRATVQQRSVIVGAVVVAAAVFQVLFLRRLFQERHLTATDKPRAWFVQVLARVQIRLQGIPPHRAWTQEKLTKIIVSIKMDYSKEINCKRRVANRKFPSRLKQFARVEVNLAKCCNEFLGQ